MTEYQPRRALREDEPAPASADSRTTNAPAPARPPSLPSPAPSTGPGGDYLSHRQILVIMGGLMAGMFLAALDQSIVAVALTQDHLPAGRPGQAFWVVTAYLLTSTAATPLWGKISDLRGRRPMFQAAIVVFLIGSLICGFSARSPTSSAFRGSTS